MTTPLSAGDGQFLIAKSEDSPYMFDAGFVRSLIAKAAEPERPRAGRGNSDLIILTKAEAAAVIDREVGVVLGAQRARYEQVIAKQAADARGLQTEIEALKVSLAAAEKQAAQPAQGAPPVDVAKALERKSQLYAAASAPEQNQLAHEMQQTAIEAFSAIRSAGARRG